MPANGSPTPTQPDQLPSRVRYAKAEIAKALAALERLRDEDADRLGEWIRVLELEDQLRDAREQAARWRQNYEAMRDLFTRQGMHPELAELDRLMRLWAVKA